jgi:hypothetical protein
VSRWWAVDRNRWYVIGAVVGVVADRIVQAVFS